MVATDTRTMPQLARWLTFIEEFDYEIIHRDGKRHTNADGLSRRPDPLNECPSELRDGRAGPEVEDPCITSINQTDSPVQVRENLTDGTDKENIPSAWSDMAEWQRDDPEFGRIVQLRLQSAEKPPLSAVEGETEHAKRLWNRWDQLEVRNELAYRHFVGTNKWEDYLQLLVPRRCIDTVLRNVHAGMAGGHYGRKKTTFQVKRRFYWSTWKTDTVRHCRRCPECNEYHRGKLKRQGPLQPVIAGAPFERLYVDVTGPHPRSDRGATYIVTCQCAYTKWCEAFAIRNREAETIARFLVENIFTRFGTPLSLLTDQGKEVDGRIMRSICELLEIDKLHTTAYKPSTDQVERTHRTINTILAKMVSAHQRDWDQRLPYAMAAYRASRHEATGFSPNMLMLAREARMPVDIVYGPPPEHPEPSYDSYVSSMRDRLITAYAEVRQELRRSAERNKKYYDVRVRRNIYKVGDWVYYYNPRKYSGKQDKW